MSYTIKGKTVSLKFTSRASVKVNDSFYTIECCEERMIPDTDDVIIENERQALWDTVNSECDKQIEEIVKTFKNS